MAIIFQDYFEGYPLGPVTPTGWTVTAFSSDIVTGGIDGGQCWNLFGTAHRNEAPASSISLFFALWQDASFQVNKVFQVGNFNPGNINDPINRFIAWMKLELDGTVSVVAGDGKLLGNTGIIGYAVGSLNWIFFQLNLEFKRVTVGGVDYLNIVWELAADGSSLMSGDYTTNIAISGLFITDAKVNHYDVELAGFLFDSVTAEDQVPIDTYPQPGVPVARASQLAIEVSNLPSDTQNRVSQLPIEFANLPNNAQNRVSQMVIEIAFVGTSSRGGGMFPEYIKRRQWIGNN